jgi:hypothetical protein
MHFGLIPTGSSARMGAFSAVDSRIGDFDANGKDDTVWYND